MYSAVGDISYIAESVVLGKSKCLDGESMGLKIFDLTIVKYIDDVHWLPNDISLAIKHLHG